MKYILNISLIIFMFPLLGDNLYKFRMIFNIDPITLELPDGSMFQVVSGKGGFTDNKGNFGDVQANGTREADKKKIS
jgi:hypothetical protein